MGADLGNMMQQPAPVGGPMTQGAGAAPMMPAGIGPGGLPAGPNSKNQINPASPDLPMQQGVSGAIPPNQAPDLQKTLAMALIKKLTGR